MRHRVHPRRNLAPVVEGMESRHLLTTLSTGLLHHLLGSNLPTITGTIKGTVTSITPTSPTTEVVSYTGQGDATIIHDAIGSGQHTITSKPAGNGTTNDTYRNGSVTLQGHTDRVAIHYTGKGHTNADGSFTATLKGHGTSIAGQHAGLSGSFTAQFSGTSRTGPFAIQFSIKL